MSEPFTDNEFLNYCLIHSETPRCLFSSDMVERLHDLAGIEVQVVSGSFTSMDWEYVQPLVNKARERANESV